MADYELDPIDPRDSEYEYAPSRWQDTEEGSYRTGSTTPPKDHSRVITVVLVMVIFFGGLSTTLSILNIHLFTTTTTAQPKEERYLNFVSGGAVSDGLESPEPSSATEATEPLNIGSAMLQISDSPHFVENIPEEGALSWQQVYTKAIDSVVSITCSTNGTGSSGTGVIMTKRGYIITNAHVVEGADSITVLLTDGRTFPARIAGSDGVSDLAVLFIEADNLTPAEFGDSSSLRVGDAVVAIGDPLGVELRGTMTDGIISAINRDITVAGRTMSLIQTTAALNSGNSGGPLLNCYGQVIGINTMKVGDYASQAGVEGLGFAIPITTVKDVVDQLIAHGYVSGRPTLGLKGQTVSSFYQYYYRLPPGLMITSIDDDSDAAAKNLQTGDIILYANRQPILTDADLSEVVNGCQVGDTVTIILYRAGQEYSVDLSVTEEKN